MKTQKQTTERTTRIAISFTLDVDLKKFMEEYGFTRAQAIEAIKSLAKDAGQAELTANGFIK